MTLACSKCLGVSQGDDVPTIAEVSQSSSDARAELEHDVIPKSNGCIARREEDSLGVRFECGAEFGFLVLLEGKGAEGLICPAAWAKRNKQEAKSSLILP